MATFVKQTKENTNFMFYLFFYFILFYKILIYNDVTNYNLFIKDLHKKSAYKSEPMKMQLVAGGSGFVKLTYNLKFIIFKGMIRMTRSAKGRKKKKFCIK